MNRKKLQKGFSVLITLLLIGAVALAGGLSVFLMKKNRAVKNEVTVESVSPTVIPTGMSKDSSDAALEKDTTDEEAKMNALDVDAQNIDQGINDKQGDLSEQ